MAFLTFFIFVVRVIPEYDSLFSAKTRRLYQLNNNVPWHILYEKILCMEKGNRWFFPLDGYHVPWEGSYQDKIFLFLAFHRDLWVGFSIEGHLGF